tara:strand:- start:487 stop:777 length:291 start_codon:yes stop_codon:yes gene_type:complete
MNNEEKIIFERYLAGKTISEDVNDQYAPEEAPEDDQLGQMEPLDCEDNEDIAFGNIEQSLEAIVSELKTLNQYVDFMTTGSRAPGFVGKEQPLNKN